MTSATVLGSLAPSFMWQFAAGAVHYRRSYTGLTRVHELGSRPGSWKGRQAQNLTGVILKRGQKYTDSFIARLVGDQAVEGQYEKIPFTYEGIMHGEMFDRIQWNGWVTGAKIDGMHVVPVDLIVNSSGAQVIREYPNIERPDEVAEVRKHLIEGTA